MFYNTGGVSNVDTIVQIRSSATLVQGMAAPILSAPGEGMMLRFEGGNYGTLTLQNWMYVDLVHQSSGTITSTTIDTSVGAEFVTFYQGAGVGSAATYYGISVELM
jgi:hypothetical protein